MSTIVYFFNFEMELCVDNFECSIEQEKDIVILPFDVYKFNFKIFDLCSAVDFNVWQYIRIIFSLGRKVARPDRVKVKLNISYLVPTFIQIQ